MNCGGRGISRLNSRRSQHCQASQGVSSRGDRSGGPLLRRAVAAGARRRRRNLGCGLCAGGSRGGHGWRICWRCGSLSKSLERVSRNPQCSTAVFFNTMAQTVDVLRNVRYSRRFSQGKRPPALHIVSFCKVLIGICYSPFIMLFCVNSFSHSDRSHRPSRVTFPTAMASSTVRALVTTMATTGTPLRAALTPAMVNVLT